MSKSKDAFPVSRRAMNTPTELVGIGEGQAVIADWYRVMTPFTKAIQYGLFYFTDRRDPADWQEVSGRQLIELIKVARGMEEEAPTFSPRYYQECFRSLERLFNAAVPFRKKIVRMEGRKKKPEWKVGMVRILQGFYLTYRDDDGNVIDLSDDDFKEYRMDVKDRYEGQRPTNRDSAANPVYAMIKTDKDGNAIMKDGKKIIIPPDAYGFRWSTDIVDDLTDSSRYGKGSGYVMMEAEAFNVLKRLQELNNGRGNPTACRLFDAVISDIMTKGEPRQVIEKPAKVVFSLLGFPKPGSTKKGELEKQDGEWSRNVERLAKAINALKAEGVLLESSTEYPFLDPNKNRRKGYYYRLKKAKEWTFQTSTIIEEDLVEAEAEVIAEEPTAKDDAPPVPDLTQTTLFPTDDDGILPTGPEIKAAREKVGLTIRDFAKLFDDGPSYAKWSNIETEKIAKRTGKPATYPASVNDQIKAFVADPEGWLEIRTS